MTSEANAPAIGIHDSTTTVTPASPDIEKIKARFAEHYPRIHRLATFEHRRLHGDLHADAVADTIALAWKSYRKKALEGGEPDRLLRSIVGYSAKHVRASKLLGGYPHVNDVMSRLAREQNGYFVTSLPHADDEEVAGEVRDSLRHRVPGPAEEAACRVDYADWLVTLSEKQRQVAEGLHSGLNMTDIAKERGTSKAAVQQIAARLRDSYDEFHSGGRER